MFANFGNPRESDHVYGEELLVTIAGKTPVTDHPIFKIRFRKVPDELRFYMEVQLMPADLHRKIFGWTIILPVFCTILEPIVLSLGEFKPAAHILCFHSTVRGLLPDLGLTL